MNEYYSLQFLCSSGKTVTMKIPFPDKTKTQDEIDLNMDKIIDSNAVYYSQQEYLREKKKATLVETRVEDINLFDER